MSGGGSGGMPGDWVFINAAEFARICAQLRAAGVDQRVCAQLRAAADSLEAAAIVAPRTCAKNALGPVLHHIVNNGDVLQLNKIISAGVSESERGVSLNFQGNEGFIPLHRAAYHGHHAIVAALLESKANVNCNSGNRDNWDGQTPLLEAVREGHPEIASALLKAGASVNMADKNWGGGETPLLVSASVARGSTTMMNILLQARAEVDHIGVSKSGEKTGETALYAAAKGGHAERVTLLLEANADRTLPTDGKTPLAIAEKKGHTVVADLLR